MVSDHQRVEVDDVIEIKWHRNPPFKIDDLGATLKDDSDTLMWKPNFTAAANEDRRVITHSWQTSFLHSPVHQLRRLALLTEL